MALAVCGRSRDSISDGSKRKVEGGVGYNVRYKLRSPMCDGVCLISQVYR